MNARAHTRYWRAALFGVTAMFTVSALLLPLPASAVVGAGIPVLDIPNLTQNTATEVSTGATLGQTIISTANSIAQYFKDFVGKPLVWFIAKAALRSITQSTVNWINSGFHGSPAFVTNPEGFLADVTDQVAGNAIERIAPLLCSPFRFDLRFALGLNYGFGAEDTTSCRLSDVLTNINGGYDSFVGGNFASGGWNSFINVSGVPQNNPYGAYLAAVDKVDARILSQTGQEIKLLDFGKGFMSWRECEVPGEPIGYSDAKTHQAVYRPGPCKKQGPIKTPGSVIESQLNSTLQTDLSSLAIASDINQIFGALLNQLVKQVFTSGGLVSARSYRNTDKYHYNTTTASSQVNDTDIGINDKELAAKIRSRIGTEDTNETTGDAIRKRADAEHTSRAATLTQETAGKIKSAQDEAVSAAGSAGGGESGQNEEVISLGKKTNQSSIYRDQYSIAYPSENSNDAQTTTRSVTTKEALPWWEVDLGKDRENNLYRIDTISEVTINRVSQYNQSTGLRILVANSPFSTLFPNGMTREALQRLSKPINVSNCPQPNLRDTVRCYPIPDTVTGALGTFERVTFTADTSSLPNPVTLHDTGRYWRIAKDNGTHDSNLLELYEFTVRGKQTRLDNSGNAPTEFDFTSSVTPPSPQPGDTISATVTVSTTRDTEGLDLRAKFQQYDAAATGNPYSSIPFSNYMTGLTIYGLPTAGGTGALRTSQQLITQTQPRSLDSAGINDLYSGNTPEGLALVVLPNFTLKKSEPRTLTFQAALVRTMPYDRFRIMLELVKQGTVLETGYIDFTVSQP